MTIRSHDLAAFAGAVDPQPLNNTTIASDWVDLSRFRSALFVLMAGATDTTVDMRLAESKDTVGTGIQDLPGRAIIAIASTEDNRQAAIGVSQEHLTRNSGYRYVRAVVTVGAGAAGATLAVVAIGLAPRFGPASDIRHADCVQAIG